MRRVRFAFVLAFFCSLLLSATLHAQTGPEVVDVRPYTPLQGSSIESVSQANGSLNLNIPVWSFTQRGGLTLDFYLRYDSPTYHLVYDCVDGDSANSSPSTRVAATKQTATGPKPQALPPNGDCVYPQCVQDTHEFCNLYWDLGANDAIAIQPFALGNGVRFIASSDIAVSLTTQTALQGTDGQRIVSYYWVVNTSDGGSHKLTPTSSGDWRVVDGTGWEYTSADCTLRDNKGVRYVFACPATSAVYLAAGIDTMPGLMQYEEDPNGNRITLNYTPWTYTSGGITYTDYIFNGWTDSLGRTIPAISTGSGAPPAGCPANSTSYSKWQPPDVTSPVILCNTTVNLATDYYANTSKPAIYTDYKGSISTIGAMVLPSNDLWTFSYQPLSGDPDFGTAYNFGELRQIGLPTGGAIQYHWGHTNSICGVLPQNTLSRSYVYERDLFSDVNGTAETWQYGASPSLNLTTSTNSVTDPLGNVTMLTMQSFGTCSYYPVTVTHMDAKKNVFKTDTTDYQLFNSTTLFFDDTSLTIQSGVAPLHQYIQWPDGTEKETAFSYDQGFTAVNGNNIQVSNGLLTSQSDYDYGSGKPGSLLRSKTTSYWALGNPKALTQNLLELPSSVTVTDAVTNKQQVTTYGYDESSLSSGNASAPYWDSTPPNGSVRGNLTSESRYLDSTGGNLITTMTYNNTGTMASLKLPSNVPNPDTTTTYGYSAAYQGGLLTSVTNALSQSSAYGYDSATFRLTSTTDANNATTTYNYYATNGRLKSIVDPADSTGQQGETDYSYPTSNEVEKQVKKGSSSWITTESFYDGLGRASQTQLLNGCPGGDSVNTETTYDLMDRVATVTNLHCGASTSATDGVTIHGTIQAGKYIDGYDALGRPTAVTDSDGTSQQQWNYSDDTTTYSDENGSSWARTLDGLGRLVKVVEPGTLSTTYGYDAFGNLTSVTQNGNTSVNDTARKRSFSYDSLSRLYSSTNPEAGTVGYTYDAHNNLLSKTDARSITTKYTYDALNRLLSKTYTNDTTGTASSCYQYDGTSTTNSIGRLTSQWTQAASLGTCAATLPATGYLTLRSILAYDSMGRIQSEHQCTKSNCATGTSYSPAYTYDLAGNILTHSNGISSGVDAMTFTNCYDTANHLLSVVKANTTCPATLSSSTTLFSAPSYSPAGGLTAATFGTGLNLSRIYDSRLRVTGETDIGNTATTPGSAILTITGTEHMQP